MKQNIIIIFTIFFYSTGFAQIPDTSTYNDLIKSGLQIRRIVGYPSDRLPRNSSQALLAIKDSEYSYDISLIFLTIDSLLINASYLEITDNLDFKCNRPYVTYENGFIKLECIWMKGIKYVTKLGVENNHLSFIDNYQYDLNDNVFSKAELAKKEDDPIAFCEAYMGAQYYSDLEYRVKESLEWAHKNALQFYKNKDYQTAASLMLRLEQRCVMSTEIYDFMGDDFIKIWSDVTLFYLKAGMNEQCVELSKRLTEIDSDLVGVYLQYGDALFNLDKKEESKSIYKTYIDLMIKNNKKDKILTRVNERTK
jgi:hypothetical protein